MPRDLIEERVRAAYGAVRDLDPAGEGEVRPARVPLPREKVMTVNVYVLGINEDREPDVFETQVTCTESEYYEESLHLAMAEERARQQGFTEPLFSFDGNETSITGKLARLFCPEPRDGSAP